MSATPGWLQPAESQPFALQPPPAVAPPLFDYDASQDILVEQLSGPLEPPAPSPAVHDYMRDLRGLYDGLEFWSLAPCDEQVRTHHCDRAHISPGITEFVWLIDRAHTCRHGQHLSWALINIPARTIVALRPKPRRIRVVDELECLRDYHRKAAVA